MAICKRKVCGKKYPEKKQPWQLYCSKRCSNAEHQERYWLKRLRKSGRIILSA